MKLVDVTEFYSERGGGIRSHLTTRGHVLCQLGHDHLVVAPGPANAAAACSGPGFDAREGVAAVSPEGVAAGSPGRTRVMRVGGPALPYDSTYHVLTHFGRVRSIVRRTRPDVLEAHSPYLATAAILACGRKAARVRTAFWHSDHAGAYAEPVLSAAFGPAIGRRLTNPLWQGVRVLLAPFDAIFAASRVQTARLAAAGVQNVVHAPFGIDTAVFHPRPPDANLRAAWLAGSPAGCRVVVGVGRLAVEKRWDVVLEAIALLQTRRPVKFVLYGDGPERDRLTRRASSGVQFAGFERDRTRLATALASADLLVHGCPYETFGLGVAEAVASGLPVVVPDAGGAAETMDPSSGRVYRSLDAQACADALDRILSEDAAELRARAVAAASRVTTLERHFGQVLAAYDNLLASTA